MPAKKIIETEDMDESDKIKGALVELGNMIVSLENKIDASVSVLGNIGASIEKSLKSMGDAIFESEEMTAEDTRDAVLDELKRGKITVDEAEERLDAVSSSDSSGDSVPIHGKPGKGKKSGNGKKGFGGGCTNLGDFPEQLCNKIGSFFGEEEDEKEE